MKILFVKRGFRYAVKNLSVKRLGFIGIFSVHGEEIKAEFMKAATFQGLRGFGNAVKY